MKTLGLIEKINGYVPAEKWYTGMIINDTTEEVEALHKSWGSATRKRGTTCIRCQGRGYTRKDLQVGCETCTGTGVTT